MSSTLFWRVPTPERDSLGYELKSVLRAYCGGEPITDWTRLDGSDVTFLEGVAAGAGRNSPLGVEASHLVEQIREHGAVEVREIF